MMTVRLAAAASVGANVAAPTAGTRATRARRPRAAASTPRLAPKQRRPRPHRGAPPQPRSLVRRDVASRGSANDEGTDADDEDPSGKDGRSSPRAPGSTRPPERGTGIAREFDMIVDFDAEERVETDDDGNAFFSKSGGHRRRRLPMQVDRHRTHRQGRHVGVSRDALGEGGLVGYKELGAEKSGFDVASGTRGGRRGGRCTGERTGTRAGTAPKSPDPRSSSEARTSGRGTSTRRSGRRSGGRGTRTPGWWSAAWRRAAGRACRRGGRSGASSATIPTAAGT